MPFWAKNVHLGEGKVIKKEQNYVNVDWIMNVPHAALVLYIFIFVFQHRWSVISSELQHVQAHLNEVLNNWQQWNSSYRFVSLHQPVTKTKFLCFDFCCFLYSIRDEAMVSLLLVLNWNHNINLNKEIWYFAFGF